MTQIYHPPKFWGKLWCFLAHQPSRTVSGSTAHCSKCGRVWWRK